METYLDPYPSFPMDGDSDIDDWSDTDSRIKTSYVHKLPCDKIYQSSCHKSHLIPVEIYSEIFLYTVQANLHSQTNLMLVCQYWHDIMLSTPGIHSQLRIYGWTEKKDVERFGRRWLLDVTVDIQHLDTDEDGSTVPGVNPVKSHACFMAAAGAAQHLDGAHLHFFHSRLLEDTRI